MSNRMLKADSEIVKALSFIVSNKLRDPRFDKFITITKAKTTPDFKYCKVGVSVLGDSEKDKTETIKLLKKSSGYIKKQLAQMLSMPYVPELVFELDNNAIYSERINEILETLNIPKENNEEDNTEN